MDLSIYGSSKPFVWDHDYLVKLVSGGKTPIISDPILLNAFRLVDRSNFVPESHLELAYQDKVIDIGYDEVMTNPLLVAEQLQLFDPKYGKRYLHLGAGTGYVAAILGVVAGDTGRVYSLERVQWLWEKARKNVKEFAGKGTEVLYRDGSEGLRDKAPYDGIIYSFAVDEVPDTMFGQLAVGGRLIAPFSDHTLHILTKKSETDYEEEIIHGFSAYNFGVGKIGVI